jgi:hypothetical protein
VNATAYTASGTYTVVTGCHTEVLTLTITPSTTSSVTQVACGPYTWAANGQTYTASGSYTNVVGCNTETLHLTINSCSSLVTLQLNIEGYYDTAVHAMRPVLANQGVGTSTVDVDDVTVELRDSVTYAVVASTVGKLQTNGTVSCVFITAPSGSFYIAVRHRNALETWSATAQAVGATPLTYDFTTSASQAYGDNMVNLGSGVFAFYSGDINQDGFIEALDFTPLFNDSDNFAEGVYATDLNGDGFVEALDFPILFNNSDNFIETLHP